MIQNSKKVKIKMSSSNKNLLDTIEKKLSFYFKINSSEILCVNLPTKSKNMVFLRSPHVNKKSKEHFGLKMFSKFLEIKINQQQVFYFLTLLKPNLKDIQVDIQVNE